MHGGISGWIGGASGAQSAPAIVRAMLPGEGRREAIREGGALAARPGVVPAEVHAVNGVLVALEGRARFRTPELAALAKAEGPASALAQAYRAHGIDCLEHIGGSFALALVDAAKQTALLAVDRMGIGTLCYAAPINGLVFGSTAESVAAHPDVGAHLDPQAVYNYLYCHVVPSPGTIFRGVSKLRPGERLVFRNNAADRRYYWQLHYAGARRTSAELERQFRPLLREATGRAVDGEASVGAFLSGGTDSSTVTGLLTELRGRPAKTYSIGFAAEGFDEMDYARITARHFGSESHEYYVTPRDVAEAIPLIASAYDEPFGNASAVPTYLCARMARADGIAVMLAGDGGDEIFGGNARYATQKVFEAYGAIPRPLRLLLEPLALGLPGGDRLTVLRKMRSYVRQAKVPLPDRLESYNFLERTALADVFEPDFLAAIDPRRPLELLRETYRRTDSEAAVERMMHLDLTITLADNDLRKVSRTCELAGVEARYPLLDDALVEFSGSIPPRLKVNGMKLRYFFKRALKDFLPPETLAKTKHGFGLPFGLWVKQDARLSEVVNDSLAGFRRRGIVKPAYVAALLRQHAEDHATYFGVMIWVMMMLERWLSPRNL